MKKNSILFAMLLASILFCFGQRRQPSFKSTIRSINAVQSMIGTPDPQIYDNQPIMDVDSNQYKTVKIGNQIWMAENLKVSHYRNGDLIANVTDSLWGTLSTGAWCFYENNKNNGDVNGRLYNFFAISDKRNLAPKGWHVATASEWKTLIQIVKGIVVPGETPGETPMIQILDSDNKLNFNLLGGCRSDGDASFMYANNGALYWSSTEYGTNEAWEWMIVVTKQDKYLMSSNDFSLKHYGCYIRCVKDEIKPQGTKRIVHKKKK